MFKLKASQKIVEINNTSLGGDIGELPTVLIGSIFQKNHYIVKDAANGIFDKKEALLLLQAEEEYSSLTGNPRITDVVAENEISMIKYLDFIIQHTNTPFLIDAPLAEVRIKGLSYCAKENVLDRAIYNALEVSSSEEEFKNIKELGAKNAVVMAFSSRHMRPMDRLDILLNHENEPGLLNKMENAGINNILIDPGVLDLPSNSWSAQAMWIIKNEIGYPVGGAPSNALYTWLQKNKMTSPALEACGASVFALPVFAGADFIFYGPLQNANWVYPAVAITDAMLSYGAKLNHIKPKTREHPIYKIF